MYNSELIDSEFDQSGVLRNSVFFDKSKAFELSENPPASIYQVVISDTEQKNDYEKLRKLLELERNQLISDFNVEHTDDDVKKYLANKMQAKISKTKSLIVNIAADLKKYKFQISDFLKINEYLNTVEVALNEQKKIEEVILNEQKKIQEQAKRVDCDIEKLKKYLFRGGQLEAHYKPDKETENLQKLLKQQKKIELVVAAKKLECAINELNSEIKKAETELEVLKTRKITINEQKDFEQFVEDMHTFAKDRMVYGNSFEIKDIINQDIKDKKNYGPYFYIITNEDHWFFAIRETNNVMIIDLSLREASNTFAKALRTIDEKLNVFVNNKKIQHNSGCCEMYAIMLPYLILRLQYFNYLEDTNFIFTNFDFNKNTFEMAEVLVKGLSEQAFTGLPSLLVDDRLEILNKQMEKLKSQNALLYSKKVLLNKIFLSELGEELEFLKQYNKELSGKENIKGGFMFRYAVNSLSKVMGQQLPNEYLK